jgi:hypothetical protein
VALGLREAGLRSDAGATVASSFLFETSVVCCVCELDLKLKL